MRRFRPVVCTSIGFTVSALGAWFLAAYWTEQWAHLHALSLVRPAAAALSVAAVACWLTCWLASWLQRHDPEKEALKQERVLLVKTLGAAVPMAETELRPPQKVRRVQ